MYLEFKSIQSSYSSLFTHLCFIFKLVSELTFVGLISSKNSGKTATVEARSPGAGHFPARDSGPSPRILRRTILHRRIFIPALHAPPPSQHPSQRVSSTRHLPEVRSPHRRSHHHRRHLLFLFRGSLSARGSHARLALFKVLFKVTTVLKLLFILTVQSQHLHFWFKSPK